ncbi:hypothetical protein ACTFIU_004619 [Dictyostelium citrinum]
MKDIIRGSILYENNIKTIHALTKTNTQQHNLTEKIDFKTYYISESNYYPRHHRSSPFNGTNNSLKKKITLSYQYSLQQTHPYPQTTIYQLKIVQFKKLLNTSPSK